MSAEPLPCPFCGGTDCTVDPDIESVVCNTDGCLATGPSLLRKLEFETEEQMFDAAIAAWNKRV